MEDFNFSFSFEKCFFEGFRWGWECWVHWQKNPSWFLLFCIVKKRNLQSLEDILKDSNPSLLLIPSKHSTIISNQQISHLSTYRLPWNIFHLRNHQCSRDTFNCESVQWRFNRIVHMRLQPSESRTANQQHGNSGRRSWLGMGWMLR